MEIMIEITSNLGESFAFGFELDDEGKRADLSEADVYYDMSEAFYENYYLFEEKIELLEEDFNRGCSEVVDKKHRYELAEELVEKTVEPINVEVTVVDGVNDYVFPYDLKRIFIDMVIGQII